MNSLWHLFILKMDETYTAQLGLTPLEPDENNNKKDTVYVYTSSVTEPPKDSEEICGYTSILKESTDASYLTEPAEMSIITEPADVSVVAKSPDISFEAESTDISFVAESIDIPFVTEPVTFVAESTDVSFDTEPDHTYGHPSCEEANKKGPMKTTNSFVCQ